MPVALIPWLASAFTSLITFFGAYLSKKVALAAAAVGIMTGLYVAFWAAIVALGYGLSVSLPGWAVKGAMFLPGNTASCISIVITAKLARMVFDYHRENLKLASYIT